MFGQLAKADDHALINQPFQAFSDDFNGRPTFWRRFFI